MTPDNSYLKSFPDGLDYYFNTTHERFIDYVKEVNNYFLNSDITYGAIVPSTTKFSILGTLESVDVYPFEDYTFYETRDDGFTYFYLNGDYKASCDIFKETNTISGNTYEYRMFISKYIERAGDFLKKEDYELKQLTNEIFDNRGTISPYSGFFDNSSVVGVTLKLSCTLADFKGQVNIKYLGEDKTLDISFSRRKRFENEIIVNSFFEATKDYEEGDIEIISYSFNPESVILLKK